MEIIKSDIEQIKKYLKPPPMAAYIKPAYDVFDDVIESIHNPTIHQMGVPIHYHDYAENIRFRSGEVSVWSGQNYTGKSEILNQFVLNSMNSLKAFIISPEMPLVRTMQYMTYQALNARHPSRDDINRFREYTKDKLYLFDQQTTLKPDMLLAVIRYAVDVFKVDTIIIDSLMKCGIDENKDHGLIKNFIDQLCVNAKNLNIHIHIVAHSKKPLSNERPSRYDVKGSGSISDLVDNVFIMWRNWQKEYDMQDSKTSFEKQTELREEPDAKLICDKQRHGDWVGVIPLWHDEQSRTFLDGVMKKPVKFV